MIFLESEAGEELKVQKSHDELQGIDLQAGRDLILHWEPDSSHVLPGE